MGLDDIAAVYNIKSIHIVACVCKVINVYSTGYTNLPSQF